MGQAHCGVLNRGGWRPDCKCRRFPSAAVGRKPGQRATVDTGRPSGIQVRAGGPIDRGGSRRCGRKLWDSGYTVKREP